MNKNLKKVISTVAALAISASAVSAFAVNFPDVPADASYAQAVQELSALKVISGFEDGTFRPDELVTRAQITKMIVDALAETAQAESSKAQSQFTDVVDHWAQGYVNQGVADAFIAGYGDGTFGPDDNVTYVQAQKMLVSAIGYETYAQGSGGWPNGYKTWAATAGITKGISGIADDTQLTRAQVAQLVDNAMGAPIVVITGYENNWDGSKSPKLKVKDQKGEDYQTLFTKRHNAYKVYGRVTDTPADGKDAGKVDYKVEKADNFDDEYIKATNDNDTSVTVEANIGDSKADDYLTVYSQALIQKDEDSDEWNIISIVPAAANKSVSVLAEDVDESKSDVDGNPRVIYFFPAGTTRNATKYKLADTVSLYVNGVASGEFDAQAYAQYIYDGNNATNNMVTLQKTTSTGSTSTEAEYDTIFITAYTTAVVDQVIDKTNQTQINFKAYKTNESANLKVQKDDDTKTYTFTLDGEAIDAADLQENDVLSISYNMSGKLNDSDFVNVQVSRNVVESAKCTSAVNSNNEITVGGEKYEIVLGMQPAVNPETSLNYTLYLDAFGKVAYMKEDSSTKKLAILKSVYQKSNGDYVADLITKEGEVINEVKVDDTDAAKYQAIISDKATKLAKYPEQVVDYKISSANKLTKADKVNVGANVENGEYKENSKKIGSLRLGDSTTILDIEDVDDDDSTTTLTLSDLKDGNTYTAYGYDKNDDGEYRFVIITDGKSGYDSTTQLSIFLESSEDTDEDGDDVVTMTVVNDGEQKTVVLDEDIEDFVDTVEEGDAILYVEDAGEVIKAVRLFSAKGALKNATNYAKFSEDALDDLAAMVVTKIGDKNLTDELKDGDEDNVDVKFGVLVKNGNSTTLVTEVANDGTVNVDGGIDLVTSNATVYTYNFDNSTKNFGRIVLDDGIMTTPDVTAAWDDNKVNYDLTDEAVADSVVFAVVRTFDNDEAQEIYQIIAE